MRRFAVFSVILWFSMMSAGAALAFGTVTIDGQNREHERITRHALQCRDGTSAQTRCFEPKTLDELAGGRLTFGAVGSPDNLFLNPALVFKTPEAHCDTEEGPHARSDLAILRCRAWMEQHMRDAVLAAALMLNPDGTIDDSQMPTFVGCLFNGSSGRAKCTVLEQFGIVLHAAQDFYSHSNWTDSPYATAGAPKGLDRKGRADLIDLSLTTVAVPPGLVSGCFTVGESDTSSGCAGQIKHFHLNKDKGPVEDIMASTGALGITSRGLLYGNFERAVRAAVEDTKDKWQYFQRQLVAAYGDVRGNLMICAITHDDPAVTCQPGKQASRFPFNLFVNIGLFIAAAGLLGGGLYLAAGRRRRLA